MTRIKITAYIKRELAQKIMDDKRVLTSAGIFFIVSGQGGLNLGGGNIWLGGRDALTAYFPTQAAALAAKDVILELATPGDKIYVEIGGQVDLQEYTVR